MTGNDNDEEKNMKFFATIIDHWDEELDFLGPFNTDSEAHEAAYDKWHGDDNVWVIHIIKSVPASAF
jgi:hypothetical protein